MEEEVAFYSQKRYGPSNIVRAYMECLTKQEFEDYKAIMIKNAEARRSLDISLRNQVEECLTRSEFQAFKDDLEKVYEAHKKFVSSTGQLIKNLADENDDIRAKIKELCDTFAYIKKSVERMVKQLEVIETTVKG
jgi:methyl-accepting chemotaxis protein